MSKINLSVGDIIKENSKVFFQYFVSTQFPSVYDGLKAVHRRIIYALKDVNGTIPSVDGISKVFSYHPHSHESIYSTIAKMAQVFQFQIPLIDFKGKNGSYSNPKGYASSRYTRIGLSNFCRDIFLNDINLSTLHYQPSENLSRLEPSYLIPKIPTSLIFNNNNIGYGFTSRGLTLKFDTVCKLAIKFIEDPDSIIDLYKNCIPYYYGSSVLNFHQVHENYLNNEFNSSKLRILLESIIELHPNNTLVIKTVPGTNLFSTVYEKLLILLSDKNSWLNKECTSFKDFTDRKTLHHANLQLKFKRTSNIFEIIEKLKPYFTDTYSVFNNYEDSGYIISCSIYKLLRLWYNKRYRSVSSDLRQKLHNVTINLNRLYIYLKIRNDTDKVIDIIKNNNEDTAKLLLIKNFDLTNKQTDIVLGMNFRTLTKSSIENIHKQIKTLKEKRNEYINILKNGINNYIKEDIIKIKDKYTSKKYRYFEWDLINKYIGILATNQGYILIKNKDDLKHHLNTFNKNIEPQWYINFIIDNKIFLNNEIYTMKFIKKPLVNSSIMNTKYSISPCILINNKLKYTFHINHKNKSASIYNGIFTYVNIQSDPEKDFFTYVSDRITLIDNDWNVTHNININELFDNMKKRNILYGNKYKAGCSYITDVSEEKPYILVFKNNKINKLFLHVLHPNINKLIFPSYGEYIMIDVIPNNRYHDNYYYINGKWYNIDIDDDILRKLQKNRFIEFNLNSRNIRL